MRGSWEIEQHKDRLRFQEKRIDDLEKKVQTFITIKKTSN